MGGSERKPSTSSSGSSDVREEGGGGLYEEFQKSALKNNTGIAAGAVAVAGVALWGISRMFASKSDVNGKMMKAPGTNGEKFILRSDFEDGPSTYFRKLRNKD